MKLSSSDVNYHDTKQIINCSDHFHTYTLKELVRYFQTKLDALFQQPGDIAAVYYWSMLAYHKEFLVTPLWKDKDVITVMRTHKTNKTPFIFMVKKAHHGAILSIRGTEKFNDVAKVLVKNVERLSWPANLVDLRDRIGDRIANTMHHGILNHALEAFSMIRESLLSDKTLPIHVYGHSLGAACAVCIGCFLKAYDYKNVHVYVLSCPHVFFVTFFNMFPRIDLYKHYFTDDDVVVKDTAKYGRLQSMFTSSYVLYDQLNDGTNVKLPIASMMQVGVMTPHRVFRAQSNIMNGETITFVESDYELVTICPSTHLGYDDMEIDDKDVEIKYTSSGGGGHKKQIVILGRRRNVTKQGQITYKGRLITIREARRIERELSRLE